MSADGNRRDETEGKRQKRRTVGAAGGRISADASLDGTADAANSDPLTEGQDLRTFFQATRVMVRLAAQRLPPGVPVKCVVEGQPLHIGAVGVHHV